MFINHRVLLQCRIKKSAGLSRFIPPLSSLNFSILQLSKLARIWFLLQFKCTLFNFSLKKLELTAALFLERTKIFYFIFLLSWNIAKLLLTCLIWVRYVMTKANICFEIYSSFIFLLLMSKDWWVFLCISISYATMRGKYWLWRLLSLYSALRNIELFSLCKVPFFRVYFTSLIIPCNITLFFPPCSLILKSTVCRSNSSDENTGDFLETRSGMPCTKCYASSLRQNDF